MITTAGAVVATIVLVTACSGHGSQTASSPAPKPSVVLTESTPSASSAPPETPRVAAVRLCDVFATTVEPEIAKTTKAKDGLALTNYVLDHADPSSDFYVALLAATRAGAPDVTLAKDAFLLYQNMFSAGTGKEFGTLATDVANLNQDCAPYR